MRHAIALTAVALSIVGPIGVVAQSQGDVEAILARVAERLEEYYKRVQNVVCIEKTVVQPIASQVGPDGLAHTTESELRIEPDAADGDGGGEPQVVRVIRKVNGRPPRDKDKKDRARCLEPNPLSTEPLSFLLPAHRSENTFTYKGRGKGKDRDALLIDFKSVDGGARLELLESSKGIDGCYEARGSIPTQGRVWVDANSFDVLRIEERLTGPVDYHVSDSLRRRRNLGDQLVIERLDVAIRYKLVTFSNPDEAMLLPASISDVRLYRGGLQSMRVSQTFSDYQRFVTGARLVK